MWSGFVRNASVTQENITAILFLNYECQKKPDYKVLPPFENDSPFFENLVFPGKFVYTCKYTNCTFTELDSEK